MTTSTHLNLPFILPGQAQKHITHNEAVAALDTLTQLAVLDRTRTAPPASPAPGDRHIVAAAATGGWSGKSGQIAAWDGSAWIFHAPAAGWLAFVVAENGLVAWRESGWAPTFGLDHQVAQLGIDAAADGTNRLAVASDAVLFSFRSESVQVKLNKASSTATASLIFQTGFSGRAEFGTAGDDKLHLKVSPNGSNWIEAMVVDQATGNLGVGTATPAARLDVDGPLRVKSYVVAALPSAASAGQIVFVSNEAGGATLAFSDGTSWRRVADRVVVS